MGQYFLIANLDKREYINPGRFGENVKLHPGLTEWPKSFARLLDLLALPNGAWAGDRVVVLGDEGAYWREPSGERVTGDDVLEEFAEVSGQPEPVEDHDL